MPFDAKANMQSCTNASEVTGLWPCDNTNLLNNAFVVAMTPQIEKLIEQCLKIRGPELWI